MKKLLAIVVTALAIAPLAASAHEQVSQKVCLTTVNGAAPKDCVRVDTDTEFEDGLELDVDGDDRDPRGDGTSDGYVHVSIGRDGTVGVYCEDEGGYNYPEFRSDGDKDDANGENEACEP